ncbi:hypothetical protein EVAR_66422_1 [Eumeta japonica]|uniref:Uncharacterized protein n=1 Tax=Eumeta variegata TaxID=151549 RepID=A0A4C1ZZ52_EUMVA|nr:hypothetical protein EVAR_66422_1 [Eumeta japonica]
MTPGINGLRCSSEYEGCRVLVRAVRLEIEESKLKDCRIELNLKMDSKRITRTRKMNAAEQKNETADHGTNENLSESSSGRERIDEEVNLHTRSDRVDIPSATNAPAVTNGPLAANMRNRCTTHDLNICDSNRNVNAARQRKRAALLAQLQFQILETERILAQVAAAYTKMLLLYLNADEKVTGDVNEFENSSLLSETDKLEKWTVILGENEPAPEFDISAITTAGGTP